MRRALFALSALGSLLARPTAGYAEAALNRFVGGNLSLTEQFGSSGFVLLLAGAIAIVAATVLLLVSVRRSRRTSAQLNALAESLYREDENAR
jgi:hypothetical protein